MALGKMTSLILPYANTDMMNLFLEEVSNDFKDYFVIMLVDGAGWHRSKGIAERYGRISHEDLVRAINGMRFDEGKTEIWLARKQKNVIKM